MREILRSTLKVGAATFASLLGWVVAGKIISLQLGAAGVGLFGLLRHLLQYLVVFATLNGQMALVQGIASRDVEAQGRFAGTVFRIQASLSLGLASLLLLGAPWLGPLLIPHPQAAALLRWLALALLAASSQAYFIGLLNGLRRIDDLVKSQAMGPLVVIGLIFPMIWLIRGGYAAGFALMLTLPGVAITLAAIWCVWQKDEFSLLLGGRFHRSDADYFIRMSAVLLATGLFTSGTQYFQSWIVARRLGLEQSGQFWVAWALSMSYVTLLLGSYSTFYMPSLSRLADPEARRALMRSYLRLSLVAMPVLVSLVILFKPLLIHLMFSHELLPSLKVMRWMLIGDYFKGISWVLAFPMLAFREMRWFFWTEVLLSLGMLACIWAWVAHGGSVEGLGALFMALYIFYALLMSLYVRRQHGFQWHRFELAWLLAGVALVLTSSLLSWSAIRLTMLHFGIETGMIAAFLAPLFLPSWRSIFHAVQGREP